MRLSSASVTALTMWASIPARVRARLALARDKLEVAFVGKNLANEAANLGDNRSIAAETPGRPRLIVNQPRTIGLAFETKF